MGCDGLWDVMTPESAGEIITISNSPPQAAVFLKDAALSRSSADNISIIVVDLETVFTND